MRHSDSRQQANSIESDPGVKENCSKGTEPFFFKTASQGDKTIELDSSRGTFSSIGVELKFDGQLALSEQTQHYIKILKILKITCFEILTVLNVKQL